MFLNSFDGGEAYTESEYRDWLQRVGLVDITRPVFERAGNPMTGIKV